tara:strand:+ start:180 stop:401 length:222 start_codon:yes stop_codon:yes gene_type:complete
MITYTSISKEGLIELYADDTLVAAGRSAFFIAYAIIEHGGLSPTIKHSYYWQWSEEHHLAQLKEVWREACEKI